MRKIFFDMDGTLTEWRVIASEEELYEKGYFSSLEPNESVVASARKLAQAGDEIYILSCVLTDSAYAQQEKEEWIRRYAPFIPAENWLFVPYGEKKSEFIAGRLGELTRDDVLVDDYTENLRDWTEHRGLAIKVMNGVNGTKGTWHGLRVPCEAAEEALPELLAG